MRLQYFFNLYLFLFLFWDTVQAQETVVQYVDPAIGSDPYHGMVVVGPSCPFGMVKPGPDCYVGSNSGYTMPDQLPTVYGFSQVHVSGTGGGAKYGNILVMPFPGDLESVRHEALRSNEQMSLGYYGVMLKNYGIQVDLTASHSVAFYRYQFDQGKEKGITIDAGSFLGEQAIPDSREAQQLAGSEVQVVSDSVVSGYSRIRGGWNNGSAYTVYFYAVFDQPFSGFSTWKGKTMVEGEKSQYDSGEKTGALLRFNTKEKTLRLKIGISFVSTLKAKQNIDTETPGWSFDQVLNETKQKWDKLLGRIQIEDPQATEEQKKMFYTALYHSMLMPVDRRGENPLWKNQPYYDDFYTIWDTFRATNPLITLIAPSREVDIVNALLNIYKYDGYLPEGRSGNSNGRTQGGSNAEVLIADAFCKELKGINYGLGLEAMLKDANVPPGGNEEKEGRGGLTDYNSLGYVSDRFVRAGNRTVEYAYNDYCISVVAKGLGRKGEYRRFLKQSDNWQNLWRDVEDQGSCGFIMPKDAAGNWIDSIACEIKNGRRTYVPYTPLAQDWPNCVCWWCGFFYEGNSWEYSFYVPQDVARLVEMCGGKEAFEKRLNTFFDHGYYNVGNEPSFLTSCLYHWIGRPDLSSERTREIISQNFHNGVSGLPGDDDSGAMSSWLAFHMLGIYPNAGQPYYLITSPYFRKTVIHQENSKDFRIIANGLSSKNRYIKSATLNGKPFNQAWIEHQAIVAGGELVFEMGDKPSAWGTTILPPSKGE